MAFLTENKPQLFCVAAILVLALLSIFTVASCRPSSESSHDDIREYEFDEIIDPSEYNGNLTPEIIRQIRKCDRDPDTMELCMRCAKITKSEIVYPMCCDNSEDVKDWCRKYLSYGS